MLEPLVTERASPDNVDTPNNPPAKMLRSSCAAAGAATVIENESARIPARWRVIGVSRREPHIYGVGRPGGSNGHKKK